METLSEEPKQEITQKAENGFADEMDGIIVRQREFFRSGATRPLDFRKKQLQKLKKLISNNEATINAAIQRDLGRGDYVLAFTTGVVITEIKYALERTINWRPPFIHRRLKQWMRPKRSRTPLTMLGSKTYIEPVPKGVVLIIGPWNYPFLLVMSPLIGAIAAGNCAVIKPSEVAPHTSKVIADLINSNFDSSFLYVVEGGVDESKALVSLPQWDHIFFTGGTEIGRSIYQAAAKNLIPVTLELGGKTPTIVDKDVHMTIAAKRITQMKFLNAGQTCMAPDYLFVHDDIKTEFIDEMNKQIEKMFGEDVLANPDYAKIVNERHFDRLIPLISSSGKVIAGGKHKKEDRRIEPVILDDITGDSEIMKEEIFGPILPVMSYTDPQEVINYIEDRPHPLALYIYTNNKKFKEKIFSNTTFGGGMVNDSVLYYLHPGIPFGGVGDSGFGSYSGKYSFETFTQQRPIVESGGIIDRTTEKLKIKFFRYPPGSRIKIRLLKLFQRTFSRLRL